jgi:hypothetical protein
VDGKGDSAQPGGAGVVSQVFIANICIFAISIVETAPVLLQLQSKTIELFGVTGVYPAKRERGRSSVTVRAQRPKERCVRHETQSLRSSDLGGDGRGGRRKT